MAALPQLMGLLGDIGNAAYTPEPNPAYGAVQVSPEDYTKHLKAAGVDLPEDYKPPQQSLWLTSDGKDVSHAINNLGLSPNDPYIKPRGLTKFFSSTARDISNRNAQAEVLGGQAGQLRNIQRTNIGNDIGTIPPEQLPFGNNNAANITSTINPRLSPSELNPEVQSQMFAQGGGNPIAAQSELTGTQNQLIGQTALQNSGNLWREQLARAGNLQYDIGLNEARLGALPNTQASIGNQAAIEAGMTGQARADLPITTGTLGKQDIIANIMAGRMNPPPFFTDRLNPNGTMSGPSRDPLGLAPFQAQMGALQGAMGPNGINTPGSTTVHTLPSGIKIATPAAPYTESPTSSIIGQITDLSNNPNADLVPLDQYPDVVADRNTGRIYTKDGHDITDHPEIAPIRQAAINQLSEQHNDAREAQHDAAQATIAAKVAALKAQQKQLQAQHQRSGLLPALYQNAARNQMNLVNKAGNWIVNDPALRYGKNAYNYLIGE